MIPELDGAHAALGAARRDRKRAALQPFRVARIEAVVAVIFLVGRIAAVDGSQPRAALEAQPCADFDQRARQWRDDGILGLDRHDLKSIIIYGFKRHGLHFLKLFTPSGLPGALLPVVTFIEVLSFISRPISLSIRLFANVLAGHITLKVFAGFVATLGSLGVAGILGAVLPLLATVALTALEFLVAALQAYVFAVLTCLYLNDALHPGH